MPSFAQEPKPVVIGGTLGLTGILSEASNDYKAVYDRWLEQVNKRSRNPPGKNSVVPFPLPDLDCR